MNENSRKEYLAKQENAIRVGGVDYYERMTIDELEAIQAQCNLIAGQTSTQKTCDWALALYGRYGEMIDAKRDEKKAMEELTREARLNLDPRGEGW